jgi:PEP-CTERM motif
MVMARSIGAALTLSLWFLLSASVAHANSVEFLNFTGLKDGQPVGNFYNGAGVASTPNYGVTFSSNFIGLVPASLGGSGAFAPDPTSSPYIYINNSSLGIMNVAGGFSSGLNFFYASLSNESITIWSGINGTGTALATTTLSASCSGFPSGCIWFNAGLNFSGTAESVTFSGPANGIGISDITLGQSTSAVPEPSSIYLLGAGLLGIGASQVRRFMRA